MPSLKHLDPVHGGRPIANELKSLWSRRQCGSAALNVLSTGQGPTQRKAARSCRPGGCARAQATINNSENKNSETGGRVRFAGLRCSAPRRALPAPREIGFVTTCLCGAILPSPPPPPCEPPIFSIVPFLLLAPTYQGLPCSHVTSSSTEAMLLSFGSRWLSNSSRPVARSLFRIVMLALRLVLPPGGRLLASLLQMGNSSRNPRLSLSGRPHPM